MKRKEHNAPRVGSLVLLDVASYAGEWPQMAEVLELRGTKAMVHWYKGSKTGPWSKCTKRVPGSAKWEPWTEEVNISDIWLADIQLTGSNKLPQKIRDQINNKIM